MDMVKLGFSTLLALVACIPDGTLKYNRSTVPEELGDGWPIATPESVGLDPAVLESLHQDLLRDDKLVGVLGLLIVKDGKLVWETYVRDPADRDRHHHVQSVTKSVTSLAFGLAFDRGLFPSLSAPIQAFIPDALAGLDPEKGNITLDDLMTMRSGLSFNNDDFAVEMWIDRPANPLRYMLMKPVEAPHGTQFHYQDVNTQIVAYILERVTGESEESLVRRQIFAPLGIADYYWDHGPDGVTMAPHGLHLRARDMAKLGQLMVDAGSWNGTQLVSQDWIRRALDWHVVTLPVDPQSDGYGYYFWLLGADPVKGWYSATGAGGQYIIFSPAKKMVIVQIAMPNAKIFTPEDLNGETDGGCTAGSCSRAFELARQF